MENLLHVGLDVGSTTVKIIVMDKENFIVKPESNPNYTLFKNR